MKIYHLLAKQTKLEPISGDRINEIVFLKTLSRDHEVYYNNQRFVPDQPDFGLADLPIAAPHDDYDLYIVRNNIDVFLQLPRPKVWIACPYNAKAFEEADAVATFNRAWQERLQHFHSDPDLFDFFSGWYPKDMVAPKQVINLGQVLDASFTPRHGSSDHFRYRARFGFGFVVGYFGRIVDETLPRDYLSILPRLEEEIPELCTVFAGSIRVPLPSRSIRALGTIPFADMPDATSACDVVLSNEQPAANWAGSAKPLEAMACGIPILLTARPSRVEQLGEDYPLFYEGKDDLCQKMLALRRDRDFYEQVRRRMLHKARSFFPGARADELNRTLREFVQGGGQTQDSRRGHARHDTNTPLELPE